MKKLLLICLLGAHTLQAVQKPIKVKIYRHSFDGLLTAFRMSEIGTVGYIGSVIPRLIEEYKKHRKIHFNIDDHGMFVIALVWGALSHATVNALQNWQKRLEKPILVFDEEGFTYDQQGAMCKDFKVIRCRWKDVISHWVTGTVNEYGMQLEKHWNYHVKGIGIVSINVLDLNIPEDMRAKVESLRQGKIRALTEE